MVRQFIPYNFHAEDIEVNPRTEAFSETFISSPTSFLFENFECAYEYGKRVARRLSFGIRIKTSSSHDNQQISYKYVIVYGSINDNTYFCFRYVVLVKGSRLQ